MIVVVFPEGDESVSAKLPSRSACQSVNSPERLQSEGLLIIKTLADSRRVVISALNMRELLCLTLIKLSLAPKSLAAVGVGLLALGTAQARVSCDSL